MIGSRPAPISSAIILPTERRTRKAHALHWPIGGSMFGPSMTVFGSDFRRKECWRKMRVSITLGTNDILDQRNREDCLSDRQRQACLCAWRRHRASGKQSQSRREERHAGNSGSRRAETHYICGSTDLRRTKQRSHLALRSKITNPLIMATPPPSNKAQGATVDRAFVMAILHHWTGI